MTAQQLKNSILQMAVQGKLVPQDPADEPASVLVERIRAEKVQLVKEKKIKKEKNPSHIYRGEDGLFYEKIGAEVRCISDELPFDVPESWEWVRLGSVCNYGECVNAEPKNIPEEAWLLDLEDIEKDTGTLIQKKLKRETKCNSTKHYFHKGQVLYSKLRPYLNKVIVAETEGYCTSEILPITFLGNIFPPYAQLFLMNPSFIDYTVKCSYGVKMPRLGTGDGKAAYFALPPLAEQQRIVDKYNELLPSIEKYDIAHSKIEKLNNNFPEQLKKSVLQWAVQGKLVEQDPTDEPASELIERIRAEKAQLIKDGNIKKDKQSSTIYKKDGSYFERVGDTERCIDEEIPFDIPESWEWVRLPEISNFIGAGGDKPTVFSEDKNINCQIPIYSNGEKNNGLYGFTDIARINEPSITISGRGTIGFSCIRNEPYVPIVRLISVTPNKNISIKYLYYVFCALFEKGIGTSIQQLTVPMITPKLIPLPPLAEQQRIVDKVEEVISLCTTM